MRMPLFVAACLAFPACGFAQILKVSEAAWLGLDSFDRAKIQTSQIVEVRAIGSFGTVIDNQGINESTPSTHGGAALGGAIGDAAYLDRAMKSGNYSAKTQLASGLVGAILGSALDRPAVQLFHFRYALQLSNGEIQYHDSVQSNGFRHPVGMCLSVPDLSPLPQGVCRDTSADLQTKYLAAPVSRSAPVQQPTDGASGAPAPAPAAATVMCKLSNLQPVATSPQKCLSIGGSVQ